MAVMCAATWMCLATFCVAQGGGSDASTPGARMESSADRMSFKQIMATGGGTMYVIAALSLMTVFFIVYFAMVVRNGQVAPKALRHEIVEKVRNGELDAAAQACDYRPCALSSVALAAIEYVKNTKEPDHVMLKDVIEGEGARQSEAIQGQTQYLLDIAVIAPMLGLLGTVVGMLQAFNSVALEIATAKPVALFAGVSKALVATAFGLIVGIPAMGFYGYFRRKAANVVSYLEVASIEVMSVFKTGKSAK